MAQTSITVIPFSNRDAWERATQTALPSQTWGHAAGLQAQGMTPELAVVEAHGALMVLPFHRRSFQGAVDIATLPGLSGALISLDSTAPLNLWRDFATSQGFVSGYIQLSPMNDRVVASPPDEIKSNNALYIFDLMDWDIDTSVGYKMRRNIKAGNRLGAEIETDPGLLCHQFQSLHGSHLARMGAMPTFSGQALDRWFSEPGIVAFGARIMGKIVNIQMGRRKGLWADLHLAGSTPEGRDLQAWVIWKAIEWLREQGVRYFNIGGYGHEGDGLHWMKARFGAQEHPLRAVHQIYDQNIYQQLCGQRTPDPLATYFPAYRG